MPAISQDNITRVKGTLRIQNQMPNPMKINFHVSLFFILIPKYVVEGCRVKWKQNLCSEKVSIFNNHSVFHCSIFIWWKIRKHIELNIVKKIRIFIIRQKREGAELYRFHRRRSLLARKYSYFHWLLQGPKQLIMEMEGEHCNECYS